MLKATYPSRLLISLAVAAVFALPVGPAFALSTGDYVGKTVAEITKSLEQQGYKVDEIEREDDLLEAKAALDGQPYEIYTDPRTGKVVEIKEDNGDEDGSIIKRMIKAVWNWW